MNRQCKNCTFFTEGVSDELRHKWGWSNLGRWADGVCNLEFPRGYIARTPPHPTMSVSHCFQWEERSGQMDLWEAEQ